MKQPNRCCPATVWIFGTMALLLAFVLSWNTLLYFVRAAGQPNGIRLGLVMYQIVRAVVLWSVGIGLFRRRRWARWGLLVLLAIWLCTFPRAVRSFPERGPLARTFDVSGSNPDYQRGRRVSAYVIAAVVSSLGLVFAFSGKVGRYFRPALASEAEEPPEQVPYDVLAPSWICASCEENVPTTFEVCWNCQSPRSDDAEQTDHDEAQPRRRSQR